MCRLIVIESYRGAVDSAGNRRRDVKEIIKKHPHKVPVSITLFACALVIDNLRIDRDNKLLSMYIEIRWRYILFVDTTV